MDIFLLFSDCQSFPRFQKRGIVLFSRTSFKAASSQKRRSFSWGSAWIHPKAMTQPCIRLRTSTGSSDRVHIHTYVTKQDSVLNYQIFWKSRSLALPLHRQVQFFSRRDKCSFQSFQLLFQNSFFFSKQSRLFLRLCRAIASSFPQYALGRRNLDIF